MKKIATVLLSLVILLTACSNQDTGENTEKQEADKNLPQVYATTLSVVDFATKIAGDRAEVINLMEGVSDPHHWEPSPGDIAALNEGELLLINGAGYEGWVDSVVESLEGDIKRVDTSEGLELLSSQGHEHGEEAHEDHGEESHDHDEAHDEESHEDHGEESHDHGEEDGHNNGAYDPHYWMSPEAAKTQAENIYKALVELDPEGEATYQANYDELIKELEDLDREYEEALENHAGKSLIVPHKAFSYLTEEYDLLQIPIEGLLADGDPNPQRMSEIVDLAEEQGIQAVFYDPYASPKVPEQIAAELGVETLPLYTIESISEEDAENGEDYFTLMRKNLDNIIKSFEK